MQLKNFSPSPLNGEVERAVLLWPCLENTWKKAFIDDLFVPIGISFIEKKEEKKMRGDETFLFKKGRKRKREREFDGNALENKRESDIEGKISSSFLLRRGP